MKRVFRRLAKKGLLHWAWVGLTIAVGLYVGHRLSEARMWLEWRYAASDWITRVSPRPPLAKFTSVVSIDSKDYWAPGLAARVPISRRYLANLVRVVARGGPILVALDFDMRSPRPDGSLIEFPEFEQETRELIGALREVARSHHVVVSRAIWDAPGHHDESERYYQLESDVWNLDPELLMDPHVHSGYLSLPADLRMVPVAVPLINSDTPLDSFSLAIARAREPSTVALIAQPGGRKNLPVATYMPRSQFPAYRAGKVLRAADAKLKKLFAGRIVIIGSEWNTMADGRGPIADTHRTPAGDMTGAFVHANFVEAMLDQRAIEPVEEWIVKMLEILVLLFALVVFAVTESPVWKAAGATGACAALVALNFLMLHTMGRFFDFFIPLVVIVMHIFYEQVSEWRHDARLHKASAEHGSKTVLAATLLVACLGAARSAHASGRAEWRSDDRAGGTRVDGVLAAQDDIGAADPSARDRTGEQPPGGAPDGDIDVMGPRPVTKPGSPGPEPTSEGGTRRYDRPVTKPGSPGPETTLEGGLRSHDEPE